MIVECNNCHAKYNVDESKIPDTGIKVKCHKCQSIIFIQNEQPAPEPVQPESVTAPPPEPPPEPTPPAETAVPSKPEKTYGEVDLDSPPPGDASIPEETDTTTPTEPEVPTPEPPEPEETEAASFKSPESEVSVPTETVEQSQTAETAALPEVELSEDDKKWHERARRLAKALASDLVLYNQDKVEEGLRDGTLAQLLGSEIRRSWEYYCQQIPKHIVDNSDYFKDQLNKIVGKGKEIFK